MEVEFTPLLVEESRLPCKEPYHPLPSDCVLGRVFPLRSILQLSHLAAPRSGPSRPSPVTGAARGPRRALLGLHQQRGAGHELLAGFVFDDHTSIDVGLFGGDVWRACALSDSTCSRRPPAV